jgi:tRNA(fMet)-specific endonuclease VapC
MGIVLDTSLIVAAERRKFDLASLLSSHPGETTVLSAVTVSELLVGVHRASADRLAARSAYVNSLIDSLSVIAFDLATARIHAALSAEMTIAGIGIGAHDLLIAATAIQLGFTVATRDKRSFPNVPGLQVELH